MSFVTNKYPILKGYRLLKSSGEHEDYEVDFLKGERFKVKGVNELCFSLECSGRSIDITHGMFVLTFEEWAEIRIR